MSKVAENKTTATVRRFKPYPAYRDSGVEWLGQVPDHWDVVPIKYTLAIPITDGPHETPEFLQDGIPFLSAEAVKDDRLDFNRKRGFISKEDHARFSRKYVPKRGDVYMVKSGATTGSMARVETDEVFNIWSPLAVLRPHPSRSLTDFIFYFMKSRAFLASVEVAWSFGTQQNIGMGVVSNLRLALPPLEDQHAIAYFLNREMARLDRLIAKKERQIELLQEKRSALISHAVTKSLNPRAKMKDSGIEWLGEIPAHWEVKRVRMILRDNDGIKIGPFGSALKMEFMRDRGYKVFGQEHVISGDFQLGEKYVDADKFAELSACEILAGDLVISMMGTTGKCQVVPDDIERGIMDSHLLRIRLNESVVPKFLARLINESFYIRFQVSMNSKGSIMEGLNSAIIKNLSILLPNLREQQAIAAFLDRETAHIDVLIGKVKESISLLLEYRTALISAAVTGKIDVREEAA